MSDKHFYSHLVEFDSIVIELNKMNLTEGEKTHLLGIIDESLHHTVLDAVLSQLSEEDKKVFLEHVISNDHNKIWKHLNSKVDNIEEKIKIAAHDLKKKLHEDVKEAGKKKS